MTRRKPIWLATGILVAFGLLGVAAACGDDEDEAEQAVAHAVPEAVDSRAQLVAQFPADVQPLLADIPERVIAALWDVRQQVPGTVVFRMSAGELEDAQNRAYREEWGRITGWEVLQAGDFPTLADVKLQAESGNPEWDIVELGLANADLAADEGLLEKLDLSLLQHATDQYPEGYTYTDNWITYTQSMVVLVFRTDVYPLDGPHPEMVTDLFNTADFPGKRCIFGFPQYAGTLEYALVADGVAVDELYPLDVDRALAKLDTVKDDVVWWGTGGEAIQFIIDGQCDMGVVWHGRPAIRVRDEPDLPIAAVWDGAMLAPGALMILKDAPHYDAAMSLLAYSLTPQNQCDLLNDIGYGVPLDESCLSDFGVEWSVTAEHVAQSASDEDAAYYGANIDQLIEKFNAWLTG